MRRQYLLRSAFLVAALLAASTSGLLSGGQEGRFVKEVRPLLKRYCFECHAHKVQKGDLDLERFESLAAVRKDLRVWQHLLEQVEAGEMPPRAKPQPTGAERQALLAWVRDMLAAEARARQGDPGRVPLRRLSNAEYDATIRDLTGVDLQPAREFPADGAAGEGFTNAAEALADVTPTLFTRYLEAAKEISEHAVLLPDGFRFSAGKTRRDWTDESLARLRSFYARHSSDGRLNISPFVHAIVRHRDPLVAGNISIAEVAAREKLNAKYLGVLWQTLTGAGSSYPLISIRERWRRAGEKDVGPLAGEITEWQKALWRFVPIGSYRYGAVTRQVANDPPASSVVPLRLAVKPAPGQSDVIVYLAARDLAAAGKQGRVVWQRPRFEAAGKPPLLLRDYAEYGAAFEVDHRALFADTAKYLSAAAELTHDPRSTPAEVARKEGLDTALLERWVAFLDLKPSRSDAPAWMPAAPLELLEQKMPKNEQRPAISGWRRRDSDLPVVLANASNAVLKIPGTVQPHQVAVHPTPQEFVAIAWTSPLAGNVEVAADVTHAHPACGNGVAWWLEQHRKDRARIHAEGLLDLGKEAKLAGRVISVEVGDRLVLVVDARNREHTCDLTAVDLRVKELAAAGRIWGLGADVADSLQAGNPHPDRLGNNDVWSFVRGPAKAAPASGIFAGSLVAQWRAAAVDPGRRTEAGKLALVVEQLLTGPRPANEKDANRLAFDAIVAPDGTLLKGLDWRRWTSARPTDGRYGLPRERFEEANLKADIDSVLELRLPAQLLQGRELAVEGRLDGAPDERVVVFHVGTSKPGPELRWDGATALAAAPFAEAYLGLLAGVEEFRRCFPWYLCFPNVVPTDEVVSLKMFHREDEPLERLFLDSDQKRQLDRLWLEHRFISQQPLAENNYLPQFIGYVTQDQPKALLDYFESQRPIFQQRADEFEKERQAAEPKQWDALLDFAARAFRRPVAEKDPADLHRLYEALRQKGASQDEALRGVLARVLVAPAFLFRIEKAPPGTQPAPIDDWELASRLSYFLWSSLPDDELRTLAAAGKLRDPQVLAAQTRRMLGSERLRSLAIEFGTQWIHVRGLDALKEKNEKLFPTFDAGLRQALYEEAMLFFLDLFQRDRAVTELLDADYTFVNDRLAQHYGIPGVKGAEWRRIDGVRQYGRGGLLGLGSVHAKQSGASRTSPVLRGNWVVETLLGEKLPRPPANVPILPDEEGGADQRTTRQQVERHTSDAACAACHVRIDPFGFAFENFDAIGRWRTKESGGLPVDTRARLRDGTEFEGIDGLRRYLMTKKKDTIVRLFCQRLLGYALGRSTTLSDTSLLDEMVAELDNNEGRVSAAVLAIVRSPQFRMIRGRDAALED